jgi:hypothetical protein
VYCASTKLMHSEKTWSELFGLVFSTGGHHFFSKHR